MLAACGVPLLFMELAVGQYTRSATIDLVDFLSSDLRSIEIFSQTTLCQAGTNRGVGQAVPVATRRGGGHRHHLLPPLHLLQRHPRLEPLLPRRLLPGGSSTCTRQEVPNFSLQSPLPWSTCNNWWNSARCHSQVFTNTCYWMVDQKYWRVDQKSWRTDQRY